MGHPVYYSLHNVEAAKGTRTVALQGGGSLSVALSGGSTVMAGRLGLWDGGRVLATHQEFSDLPSRITHKDTVATVNSHTTHLAGTLMAKGVNPDAKGMAYQAQLSVWDYTNDIVELATAAPNLLVSNHSYGPVAGWILNDSRPGTNADLKWEWWGTPSINATEDYLFGFYSTKTQDIDRLTYNNPFYLMVRSADNKHAETGPPTGVAYYLKNSTVQSTVARSRNDGYDVIPADATAKNVLTIGSGDVTYDSSNQPVLQGPSYYSGWGPTDDGRIKPDLVGIGSNVLSSIGSGNTDYGTYSGTSMASANVSGSLFLLQELYARQRAAGLPATGQFMRAATLKGLALHTASRPTPSAGPNYQTGWGLLNTEAAARLLLNEDLANLVLEQSLISGATYSRTVVAQGNEPLVITLSWTDPEGTATAVASSSVDSRTPKLVNDLDVRVTDGQYVDMPFVLDPDRPTQAALRGDNVRDNVEQVYIANPTPGKSYTITVSHKGKMTYSSQPYSLLISGLYRVHCDLTASILSARDTTICTGVSLPLQAVASGSNLQYQWLRNGTVLTDGKTATYQVTLAGSYMVRVTDSNGCSASSQAMQVQTQTPTVSVLPAGNQWLCADGTPISFTAASAGGLSLSVAKIEWLKDGAVVGDATASTFQVTQPGTYQLRVTQNGCQAVSAASVVQTTSVKNLTLSPTETELLLPKGATITLKAPYDTSYQYQWYRNEVALSSARTNSLMVAETGRYKVQVTQHSCIGWSTDRVIESSIVTATTTDPVGSLSLYPNPAENTLSIRYTNPQAKQVQLLLLDGRGVLQQPPLVLKPQNSLFESDISVLNLPAGEYILQVSDGSSIQVGRFLKK